MKNTKKIGVLISFVLILLLAIGAASAADDANATADTDLAAVDEVQTVDNTQITDEINAESTGAVDDAVDSGDNNDASDTEVISDSTGLQDISDDGGDEAAVSDNANPKNVLKAEIEPDEPLRAEPDGSFSDLNTLISNAQSGSTITLDRNYVYNPSTDRNYVNGITIAKNLNINGNGFTIDGQGAAKIFNLNGYTESVLWTWWHGYTYTFNNINFINAYASGTTTGGAITSVDYPNTITINNCNFTNNRGYRGPAVYYSVRNDNFGNSVDDGSITITGSVFKDNYASNNGGAVYSGISNSHGTMTVNNNVFVNNTSPGAAKAVYYVPNYAPSVDYNWWGQNTWERGFVANSATNYVTPTYRYLANFALASSNTLELTLALNGGTAPSGSALPARNASFSIESGIVDPESEMFQGSIVVTYASLENTTITATVDNQVFTMDVSNTPKEDIGELTITVANVVLPNQADVIVNTDVKGTFNVTIGDTVKEVNITNGQATITWDSLPEGQYFAIVSCVGDIRYNDKFAYTSFKVEKQNVTITVTATPDTIEYGETVTLSSALNDTAATAGTVTYYVDGTESGTTLDDLTVGTHEIIAKYTGDPNYNDAESAPLTVTVTKLTSTINLTTTSIIYGQDATITIDLKGINDENITALVKVTIAGKVYGVAVNNGVGTLTVSGLAANEDGYPIVAEFAGNDQYKSAMSLGKKQIVYKAQPTIGVTPVEISYGEDAVVNISLELPNGEKLDNVVVYATVDGETYPVTINNGVGTLTVSDLIVDSYDVRVDFPGNDNYSSVETTRYDSIVVKRAVVDVTVGNVVVTRPATGTIVLTASAPGEYIVKVGEDEYEVTVDVAGVPVEIPVLDMPAGSYDVKVTADETQNYEAVDETFAAAYVVIKGNVTVVAIPNATEIAYGEEIKLNHSISAPEGAVLTGNISYYIDGEKVESAFSGLKVGNYTFTVSYTGDPNFNDAISAPVTLTVNKFTPIFIVIANNRTYGDHPHISLFTLRNNTIYGGISGITVLVTINNVTYAVETTDFLGGVVLELNDLDANEEGYSISAVTLETDEYASVSNNTEVLKIYKVDTRLTIDSDRVSLDYGETSTLSHWITEGATGAVTYYLNGTAISGNVLSNLMPGNYTVTAKYEGDKNYKPADSENALDITVKKINPRLSVSANTTVIKYLDSIKLLRVFDTPASGEVVWYVNGTAQMSNIVENLKPGTYTVTAKYIEDEIYYDADSLNSLTITILKDDVNITVRSDRYTIPYGDSINLNSIIEPIEAWPWEDDVIYIVDGRETSSPAVSGLGVGTHTIIAKYVENDYFNEAYSEAITVNVIKATPVIEVLSDPVTYPNDAIVNFIVKGNNNVALPGVGLRVTINGVGYYVETGSDGKAVLTVKGLNVGEYTIGTVTVANDNYSTATNNTEKIIVNKGDLTITAGTSASSVPYGGEISFTNAITVPEGGVAAGTVKYYVDGNEIAGDSISTLAIGDHTVVAEYSGDANFNAVNSTAVSFTVTKGDPTLIISANATEIQYLDKIKLSYTLTPDGATGSVVYYLDGTPVDGDVLKLLEPGTYTVTAKYEGNDFYNEADSSNSLSITVGKCDVSIEVNSNNYTIEYGQAILLTASYDPFMATGYITYIVDGVEGDEYYFTDLSVGTHSIAARFNENVFYNGALSETKTITVTKATPEITVTANPIVYGQNATITIGLDGVNDEKITGVVKVTINGKIYDVAVTNGVGTLTISGLAAREDGYPISAEFAGNDRYKSANNYSTKQIVNKAQPAFEVTPVEIEYGEDAVVAITLEVPNGEKLDNVVAYATVDGETYPVTINNGVGTFTVSGLIVDKYDVRVEFPGNDNYSSAETTRYNSIVVKKAIVDVNVGNVVVIYPAGGKIIITASAPGEYIVKVGEDEYEVVVDLADVPVEVQVVDSLPVGPYDVKVTADETQNYEAVDVTFVAAYIVNSGTITVSAQDLTVAYPNKGTIVITTDVAGNYTIKVGDKTYENVQLVAGANNFPVPDDFDVGTYDVKVSANIANYDAITDLSIASYTVTTANTTLVIEVSDFTYGDDAYATIILKQGDTPLAGKMINITVDGIQRIETTNQSGVATLDLDLLYVGRYNIVAIFEGEGNYALAYNSSEFKVNKATPTITVTANPITYGQDATITIGLDGVNGEKITGVVKVTINEKDYDVPVTNGAGTLTVSGLVVIDGGYPISAAFDGNDNYAAATNTKAKQVVNRANANIVVGHVEFEYGEEVVVPITVTGVNGEKLNGTVDAIAQDYYVVTIENGTGFIRPTGLSVGIYEVTAEFRGNENYNVAFIDDPLAIRITQGTINVTVSNEIVTYPNIGVISINASLPGTYTVTVGTKQYNVNIPSVGVPYQLELDEVFEVGTYDISVNRTETQNYHGVDAQNIATYTVNKGDVTVVAKPNATEITYGEEIKLNHSIIPPEGGDLNGMFTYYIDGEYAETVVSGLSAGTHTFTVLYSGDPNFNDAESAVTITVNKAKPVINVAGSEKTYPENGTVLLTVANANGDSLPGITVYVTVNDVDYVVVTNNGGVASLSIQGLDAGEYPISAVTVATGDYSSASYIGNAKVVINKITPTVEIPNSVVVTYPDTAPMAIKASVPGIYTVKVGTEEIPVVITEADTIVLFYITKVLDAGVYNVSVTADLGKNYELVSTGTLATYTVRNATLRVTAEDTVVEYPGRGEMYITVNAEGEYTIAIGDKTYTKTFYPGENWLYVGDEFALGTYDVLVSATIPNYDAVENQKIATYTVSPAEINVFCDNITVYYPYYGIVTIYSDMDGDYLVSINGTEYPVVTVTNGKGYLYPHTWIPLGVHDVLVTADFGENYKPLINATIGTYTVLKSNIDLYVVPNVTSILYGDTIRLDYDVNYYIDENCLTYVVDGKDIEGNIVTGLTVGTHYVAVRYSGDPGIEDTVSPLVSITVSKAAPVIEVTAINSTYPQAAGVAIAVKNNEGTLLSGVTVKVTVNGVDYAVETNSTGQAVLTINGLAAGEYPITAVSIAGDNYGSATNATEKLEVKAADLSIVVKANATDIKYGESISLDNVITAPEGTSVVGTVIYYVDGVAIDGNIVPAEQLTVGTHTVVAKYTGDSNFNDAESDPVTIKVGEGIINISAEDVNVTYPNSDFIRITTDVEGDYTVYLGNYHIFDTHLYAGENKLIVDPGIFAGEYEIRVSANIDDYEELDNKLIGTYTVCQADVSLSISSNATAITYGDTVSISYESDPDTILEEDIIYYVDGEAIDGNVVPAEQLTPGTHTVVARYAGDQNYKPAESNVLTITVNKAKADVTVTADPVSYPNNATVVVNSNVPGTYTIRVGNKDYAVVVGDTGSGSVVIDKLAPGTYDIDLTADLGDNYEPVVLVPAGSLTVLKATPTIDVVADENLKQGDAAGVNVTVMDGDDPVEGFVVIKVNGEEYIGELVDGKAEFVIFDLPANKYDVAAKYLETDCYNAVEYDGDACIDFITYYADFDIIIANGTYGDNLAITVENVTDSHGDSLDGHILIIVYNEDNTVVGFTDFDVTGGSGTDTIAAPCAGNLHATASFFTEYHDYESELKRVSFIVDKAVPTVNITYADGKFTVKLDGVNGEKLNETVYIIIDGNDPIEVVTENGVNETAVSDLAVGDHSAYVVFHGNDNYLSRSNFTSFNIPKKTTAAVEIVPTKDSFAYGEDVVINVTVKDGETGLSGVVNLTVDGVDYAVAVTDGVGQITVKGLKNGTFPVAAKFLGNENYTEADAEGANVVVNASTEATVIAQGSTVTYGEDSTIKVNVLDGAGNPVAVSKVNVTINGSTNEYDVVDGVVTIAKLDAGTYTATVNFTDGVHTVTSGEATLIVNPAEAQLTLTPDEGKVTIELKDGDKPLSGPVTAIIDGVETTITIPETGIYELPVTEPGTHTIAVKFAADNYVPVTEVATVSNPKLTPTVALTVDPASIPQTGSATIKVSLLDGEEGIDGTVIVTVGDVNYAVAVSNGEGSVVVKNLEPGTYTIKGKFEGNDIYEEATATDVSLEVTKVAKVDLDVSSDGGNIIIKLTDEDGNNVTGKVNVTVDGQTQEVTVNDGVATVPVGVGDHNVTVVYPGDAVHGGTQVVENIVYNTPTTKKIGTVMTISMSETVTYNKTLDDRKKYLIYATLKDINGKPLVGKTIYFSSHAKVIKLTTNSKGQVRMYVAHKFKGVCAQSFAFLGDDKYNGSVAATKVDIKTQKVKLVAKKKTFKASKKVKKLTAKLTNIRGQALAGKKITFTVNKKKYTAKTNSKGIATVKVKLSKKKTYKVTVKFAGDRTYSKKTKKTSVRIK